MRMKAPFGAPFLMCTKRDGAHCLRRVFRALFVMTAWYEQKITIEHDI